MKLLIDENLPKALKHYFPEHEIYTVRDKGWQSKKNGELPALMQSEGFEVLLTFDKNLKHQQNFAKYPIAVLVLNAAGNAMPFLRLLVPKMTSAVRDKLSVGATIISAD